MFPHFIPEILGEGLLLLGELKLILKAHFVELHDFALRGVDVKPNPSP